MLSEPLAKAKGKRLKQVMKLARFDRKLGAEIAGVSFHTYKGWEVGKHGGLPEKKAQKLLTAITIEGVACSLEWLMHGIGDAPKRVRGYQIKEASAEYQNSVAKKPAKKTEDEHIKLELDLFRESYPSTLYTCVADDGLAPTYLPGDLVAGEKIASRNYKKAIGLPCIVQTNTDEILLRRLQYGTIKGRYTLACSNPDTKQKFAINDIELVAVAPFFGIAASVLIGDDIDVAVQRSTGLLFMTYKRTPICTWL